MHIYFSGIGGVAIGPLALLARDAGYEVSGSDKQPSRYTNIIERAGIKVYTSQTGREIAEAHSKSPIDWFVYTAALPTDHPELEFAKKHNIKTSKRSELLRHIIEQKGFKLIAVSGTHGKTTTTGMIIWLFKQFDWPVSYSIGTNLPFGPSAAYDPSSEYFVYEADEFDRNFLDFKPELAVVTALDYDHPDTYPTVEDYKDAYRQFLEQSKRRILWGREASYLNVQAGTTETTVLPSTNDLSTIHLPGQHNRENARLAVEAFCELTNHGPEEVIEAVNRFPGTERRFERLADNLYSDYAHHPTEIRATLAMAKELSPLVVAVYQPHQNVRQTLIKDQYKGCFNDTKKVYWLPTYLSREYRQADLLTPEELIAGLDDPSIAEPAELNDELVRTINKHRQAGDLVVIMSAGDADEWARQHFKA